MYTVVAAGGAAGANGGAVGGTAVVGYSTAATVKSESTASMAAVCPGGSTVPATVTIVVKHRARLSVGRMIVGVQARSVSMDRRRIGAISIVIAGIAALLLSA